MIIFITERGMLCLIRCEALSGSSASPVTGRREVVVKYDTEEEVQATGEWLMNMKEVGNSEELMYVPSELWRKGIPLQDVVDRLPELRDDHATIEEPVEVVEVVAIGRASIPLTMVPIVKQPSAPVVPVRRDKPWDWVKPVEPLIAESIKATLSSEPGLLAFNETVSVVVLEVPETTPETVATPLKRTRGKRARASGKSTL